MTAGEETDGQGHSEILGPVQLSASCATCSRDVTFANHHPSGGGLFGDVAAFELSLLPYLLTHPHIHNPVRNSKNWFQKLSYYFSLSWVPFLE